MKQKLRRIIRTGAPEGTLVDAPIEGSELKDILILEKNEKDQIRQFDMQRSSNNRTFSKIRKNIEDYRSMSMTRRDYTLDNSTMIQEGSSRGRDKLPSLDSHPGKAIRSLMTQLNSKSVDRSSSINYTAKTNLFTADDSLSTKMKVLKPNARKLPSLTARPEENKAKDITRRMMDTIAGRIKDKDRRSRLHGQKYKTEQGGIGIFLSDIGFTNGLQPEAVKDGNEDGITEENQAIMIGLQPLMNLFGGGGLPDQFQTDEGGEVKDMLSHNLQKLMVSNNILAGQELKDEQEFIYYIKLLFTDESQTHEFIYAVNRKSDMPYNLSPVPFSLIHTSQPQYYYTVSKERIIKHRANRTVAEDSSMEEWLREKLKFNQLKTLEFVRKFRKIKTLKTWIGAVRRFKRRYAAKLIEFSLPILDPVLCKPILEFRQRCIDLQELNYFYVSNDRICDVTELKKMQDMNNEYFVTEIKHRDKFMNNYIREIIKNFNQLLWNTAFADLSDDLKGGLKAIKCPDPSIYDDSVEVEGTDLAFFHKLMTLNVPYRVKAKIRNICHRVLSMPLYFDSLRMSSLLQCYRYNVERIRHHVMRLQRSNTDRPSVWQQAGRRTTLNKKQEAYITVYFEIDDSFVPKPLQVEVQKIPVIIAKGKTSAIDPLEFDYVSNLTYRKIDFQGSSDTKEIDEQTGLQDLQDMMSKSFIYDRNIPQMINLKTVIDPNEGLIKINPNFDDLKHFLLKEYDDFVTVLSSFKKCSVSGEFNLYYKLLIHWAKEDLRPEEEEDVLDLRKVLDENDHKYFTKQIIDPIEKDYMKVQDISKELVPLAQQHWRNCQVPIDSNFD